MVTSVGSASVSLLQTYDSWPSRNKLWQISNLLFAVQSGVDVGYVLLLRMS